MRFGFELMELCWCEYRCIIDNGPQMDAWVLNDDRDVIHRRILHQCIAIHMLIMDCYHMCAYVTILCCALAFTDRVSSFPLFFHYYLDMTVFYSSRAFLAALFLILMIARISWSIFCRHPIIFDSSLLRRIIVNIRLHFLCPILSSFLLIHLHHPRINSSWIIVLLGEGNKERGGRRRKDRDLTEI